VNYLSSYSRLLSGIPLRVRIGGRSSENYTYAEVFASGPGGEPKPSDGTGVYGPTVVTVLQNLSKKLGVSYLLSESNLSIIRDCADYLSRSEFEGAERPGSHGVCHRHQVSTSDDRCIYTG